MGRAGWPEVQDLRRIPDGTNAPATTLNLDTENPNSGYLRIIAADRG